MANQSPLGWRVRCDVPPFCASLRSPLVEVDAGFVAERIEDTAKPLERQLVFSPFYIADSLGVNAESLRKICLVTDRGK
jgi:hypothetical protein